MTADETHEDFAYPLTDDGALVGCGYCTHCGYGGEPSAACLHKRARPSVAVIFAELGKSCSVCDDGRKPCACGLVID